MRTQRKIVHLLNNNGASGREFRYLPEVNPVHTFNWTKLIYVTDKIDGTTVQASKDGIFKRIDQFKSRDPRKFTASEEERYKLIQLDFKQPEWKWIWEAVHPYYEGLLTGLDGFTFENCIYFEVFGPKINARYRTLPKHDIRVFDFAREEEFLKFSTTINRCKKWSFRRPYDADSKILMSLPIVGHSAMRFTGVKQIIQLLEPANHFDPSLATYPLEGWVLRQGGQIAKIRKADLQKIQW